MRAGQLDKLSLRQLRELQSTIAAAISSREAQERADLKRKLVELAGKSGFGVGELFGDGRGRKRGPVAIKYRHKDDPTLTWTGRGRRPRWLVKAGGDIERFRVG